ncbi:MAG: (cytosine-5)-methyltransferase 1 [Alphaproteobacteria bacterium]|jgi:DNA (cytosine-5)-methyltransferase 1|nr:(cytosine-5)-methyltransferase 1 [Alphaproteobacteria bacterium]
MNVLSLFSGAGGLSLGLAQEGLKPALAVELNKDAVHTYHANIRGDCLQTDIAADHEKIVNEARSRFTNTKLFAIVGGPPCQGFTTAGARQANDPRNQLIFSYFRMVEELQPTWFLFENVEGLLTSGNGADLEALTRAFIVLGYSLRVEKINFAGYGLPQGRKRVLLVGNRVGINFELPPTTYAYGGKKHRANGSLGAYKLGDALAGLGPPSCSLKSIVPYLENHPLSTYDALMREMGGMGTTQHTCANYEADRERIIRLRPGQSMRDLPEEYWPESYRSRAFRRVADGMPVERRGGPPAGLRRLESEHVSLTITSLAPREFIHPEQDRPLSLRECARIQSFPDWFKFSGGFQGVALQIGNAFPPLAARLLARWLTQIDGQAGSGLATPRTSEPGLIGFRLTEATGMSPALATTEQRLARLQKLREPSKCSVSRDQQPSLFGNDVDLGTDMLDVKTKKLITRARTAKPVIMSDRELVRLVSVSLHDLQHSDLIPTFVKIPEATKSYYDLPLSWFTQDETRPFAFPEFFLKCKERLENFEVIFECLSELHKRRRKYNWILSAQPTPTMDQVARRGLLEYGVVGLPALTSWLMWRKWIYDIDNRSAQETGYLFEPILAASLGGISFGAKGSPVTRNGAGTEGRQVDCIVDAGNEKLAYEFKARFTIASSGQGRFREELDFPADCKASGYKPILLVLDDTDNDKLRQLVKAFQDNGGEAHLGEAVWNHIAKRSGKEIANFVAKYVREPIVQIDKHSDALLDLKIIYRKEQREILVAIGNQEWLIKRVDDAAAEELLSGDE